MSDAYRLDTPDAAYILKIYQHRRHPRSAIEAEVSFLNDLREQDIPVAAPVANNASVYVNELAAPVANNSSVYVNELAAPVANNASDYVNELAAPEGTRCAVLFEAIEGQAPRETNLAHSRSFGQLAGRIHRFADISGKTYDRWQLDEKYLVETPLAQIRPYLEHRASDWETLRALGSELVSELLSLLPKESPQYGMCHGDLHTGNALFGKDGRLALFDFDSCGYGWRAIDVGVYHVSYDWMGLSDKTRRKKARFWEAFVDGYSRERPLSENELAAAQLCLPLRHLELMGLTIRYWSPQIGSDWINDDYFTRHLEWFGKWRDLYGSGCLGL